MVNHVLDEIYRSGKVFDHQGGSKDVFPVSLYPQDGKALYDLVKQTESRKTLEIGMAYGISSLHILQALQENGGGAHVAIDPYQKKWYDNIGIANIERGGFQDMLQYFEEPSYLVLPRLLEANERFNFIFIDGNHRFEFVLLDFLYADKLLNVDGYMMFHDTWMPSIRKFYSFIVKNRADCYSMDLSYTGGKNHLLKRLRVFFNTLKQSFGDFNAARFYSAFNFNNYIVLKKIHERDPEEFDDEWHFYGAF
ncbi:MAG: class I SAM-dependent methyltransferase [Candidatus Hydrogenedentes bacterium]|jgi:predicted O-methyltransferase YrrM|nr:class I SAM-dependent methyltransferase [Candidatus Hydrogenedentota bacterium]